MARGRQTHLASIRSFSQREESVGLATVDDRQARTLGIRERARWVRSAGIEFRGGPEEDEVNGDVLEQP